MMAIVRPARAGVRQASTLSAMDTARKAVGSLGHAVDPSAAFLPPLTWYSCGPTVYDSAHLGHARTYVALDVLRRITEAYAGRTLLYAMGVTDIDDKILARSAERGLHPLDLARAYEEEFWSDMSLLGVTPPTATLRVTEHIPDIIDYIWRIQDNGLAYVIPGHGVYLDVGAMGRAYGTLGPEFARQPAPLGAATGSVAPSSGVTAATAPIAATEAQHTSCGHQHTPAPTSPAAAVDVAEDGAAAPGKRDARDFALWKFTSFSSSNTAAAASGTVSSSLAWDAPWGRGRPGWHIECSAMTHAWCGPRLDVHAGGVDLAFPHHCNEIAQAIAYAGRLGRSTPVSSNMTSAISGSAAPYESVDPDRWVGTWVHTGHLHIAGRKMSKSLKNFITIGELLSDGLPGEGSASRSSAISRSDCFRMFTCLHDYSSTLTYAPERLGDAAAFAKRLHEAVTELTSLAASRSSAAASSSSNGSARPATKWSAVDHQLMRLVATKRAEVDKALATDFDTPAALKAMSSLATTAVQMALGSGVPLQPTVLAAAAAGVCGPLAMLGFEFGRQQQAALACVAAGKRLTATAGSETTQSTSVADATSVGPPSSVQALVRLRSEVRTAAGELGSAAKGLGKASAAGQPVPVEAVTAAVDKVKSAQGRLLAASDAVRDTDLPALGWRVKDTPQGPVTVKA